MYIYTFVKLQHSFYSVEFKVAIIKIENLSFTNSVRTLKIINEEVIYYSKTLFNIEIRTCYCIQPTEALFVYLFVDLSNFRRDN